MCNILAAGHFSGLCSLEIRCAMSDMFALAACTSLRTLNLSGNPQLKHIASDPERQQVLLFVDLVAKEVAVILHGLYQDAPSALDGDAVVS